jgi:hypothetical protein
VNSTPFAGPGRPSRPGLELLETRDLPSATHLSLAVPLGGVVSAGYQLPVTVTALDASGQTATDYTGTVALTSSDPNAVLPASYTFTAADQGQHTFNVQLQTAGTPSLLAKDTADGTLTGTASVTVVPAAVDHFAVNVMAPDLGVPTTVLVTAEDAYGNTVTSYTGTAHFAATDAQAVLPADHTFAAADQGTFSAPLTFNTVGAQTLTVTGDGSLKGSTDVDVPPGAVTHFDVMGPTTVTVGQADTVTVVALDQKGNVATNYQGTVALNLVDQDGNPTATAVQYTFTAADAGTATLQVTPVVGGPQAVAVADQTGTNAVGSQSVTAAYATANENYVNVVYETLLGRPADRAGLIAYSTMLDQGDDRQMVVRGIEQSSEYHALEVTHLYESLLQREPDPAGLNAYVTAMNLGMSAEAVGASLAGSAEYYQLRGGGTATGFVTAVYQDMLDRAPDAGGLAAYTGLLQKGVSRSTVALTILKSPESQELTVSAAYQQFLGRQPDPVSLHAYAALQGSGQSIDDLIVALLSSDEYFRLVTS